MSFAIERPLALYAFVLLFFALVFVLLRFKKIVAALSFNTKFTRNSVSLKKIKTRFYLKTFFFSLAFAFCILAYAGISWDTAAVPVQKNGKAVSFVFDISYSMLAKDTSSAKTRLESATTFANELLDKMKGVSVSVVLAKGNGSIAVPMTEDTEAVRILLSKLSPSLMTSIGTSLGGGIDAAIRSFPVQSSQAEFIWLFTDGDETDSSLLNSLNNAAKYGIPVAIIGFGSEKESEVTAGDGKTKVNTALRSSSLRKMVSQVQTRNVQKNKKQLVPAVEYFVAEETGCAYTLLKYLNNSTENASLNTVTDDSSIAYEIQRVSRHSVFLVLAFISLFCAFAVGELRLHGRRKRLFDIAGVFILVSMFSGCTPQMNIRWKILEARLEWNRKNYQEATSYFLNAYEEAKSKSDSVSEQYALYGLASTYFMQDEDAAALERFKQVAPNAPKEVQFAVLYNVGILYHRKGDYEGAANCFKQALLLNGTNVDAKINLELSLREEAVLEKNKASSVSSVSVSSEQQVLQDVIYSVMREKEQNQWKKQEEQSQEDASKDY